MEVFTPQNENDIMAQKKEVYRGIQAAPEQIEIIKKIYEAKRCFFFQEFFFASADRKKLIDSKVPVIVTIQIEQDFVYLSNKLFMYLQNQISPLQINHSPFENILEKMENVQVQLDPTLVSKITLNEYFFPAYYPFKVKSFKTINQVYELTLSTPSQFDYVDEHFLLYNKPLVEKHLEVSDAVSQMISQFQTKTFQDFIPLKKHNLLYYPELHFQNLQQLNSFFYKNSDFDEVIYLQNNYIIQNVRTNYFSQLAEEEKIKSFESLTSLINYIKNNSLFLFINKLVFTLELKTLINSQDSVWIARFLFITDEKCFISEDLLQSIAQSSEKLNL